MRRWLALLLACGALLPARVQAHLGSPDVFFDGTAGLYPVSVAIRVPGVVPGRARITVTVHSDVPVSVAIAPIAAETAISNTPPPEIAEAVPGQTNVFVGELWLMAHGAYGIDIRVHGPAGDGAVQVPVNSIATDMLPLPSWLGKALLALTGVLFLGGVSIIAAAASESLVPPGVSSGPSQRRRYWRGAAISSAVFSLALWGGWHWWNAEERGYREHLRAGGWPDLEAKVRTNGKHRMLDLYLGKSDWSDGDFRLEPDHGKLLHLYLIRQPSRDVFAHLHPTRAGDTHEYETPLPPLPEGDYEVLCDLTVAASGTSSTATNTVHLPAAPAQATPEPVQRDPDDSWAVDATAPPTQAGGEMVCNLGNGARMIWKAHPPLRANQDAGLHFEVRDDAGNLVALQPYMGMTSHAAILREDGRVFSHLHPSGNYSVAAQNIFNGKFGKEKGGATRGHGSGVDPICGANGTILAASSAQINLPYEFPSAGNYRVWVQVKSEGKVRTAVFDAVVQAGSM
jgi:hypothetical protein